MTNKEWNFKLLTVNSLFQNLIELKITQTIHLFTLSCDKPNQPECIFYIQSLLYTHEQWKRNTQMYINLKDILNIRSQRISGDFINTNDGRHIDFC